MSLIVENGSNAGGANSYADLTQIRGYASARGFVLPDDDSIVMQYAIQAMDYIEAQRSRFKGSKTSVTQELQFPRIGVEIDGIEVPADKIPFELIHAQCRLVCEVAKGVDLMPTQSGPFVVEDTIGPSTTKYSEKIGTTVEPTISAVDALLAPLFGVTKNSDLFLKTVRA